MWVCCTPSLSLSFVAPAERASRPPGPVLGLEAPGDAVAVEEVAALGQLLGPSHHALGPAANTAHTDIDTARTASAPIAAHEGTNQPAPLPLSPPWPQHGLLLTLRQTAHTSSLLWPASSSGVASGQYWSTRLPEPPTTHAPSHVCAHFFDRDRCHCCHHGQQQQQPQLVVVVMYVLTCGEEVAQVPAAEDDVENDPMQA